MIISLEGLPGKIKVLLDRLTADRAAGLDFLTSISSWSSATNAKVPDNAAYTNALATQLSGLSSQTTKALEYTAVGAFTFTVPTGVSCVWVTLQGAGGSGARGYVSTFSYGGGGGGAGECIYRRPVKVTPGATITGTIGTGGSAATVDQSNGTTGGTTSFSGVIAAGGKGGWYSGQAGGNGGGAYGGIYDGTYGTSPSICSASLGEPLILGGASGGRGGYYYENPTNGGNCGLFLGGVPKSNNDRTGGGGGASWFANGGYGGYYWHTDKAGGPGSLGSGGGGSPDSYNSGAGGNGYAMIEWIG